MSSNTSQTASPPEAADNGEGSSRQPINPPIVTVSTPRETKAEKKKRVGFASHPSPPREEDYFSHVPAVADSQNNTPGLEGVPQGPPSRRDSFDRAELTEALEKILKPEDHSGPQVAAAIAANLRLPRPALRKTVYPESPAEPIAGLSHPSEIEARHRAGRLAESVSRTSIESHDGLLDGSATDAYDHAAATGTSASPPDDADGRLTYRKRAETDADRLVRRHTKRRAQVGTAGMGAAGAMPLMAPQTPDAGPRSGTATPVAYDLEYVPPAPPKYHGGILGTLLKLYSAEDNARANGGSGQSTPDAFRTPNRTPRSSPPSTTPSTPRIPDGPPSRPRSGLFGLGSRHSASTLAELIGSSSTLAAPASSTGTDMVTDKLKRDREKPKKKHERKSSKAQKAQEILITKQ